MLKVRNLDAYYGHIQALKDVSLSVEPGEIVSLIGANGAGKTTLLKTLSGVVAARSGQIVLQGQDITNRPPEFLVQLGVSHVPERRQIFNTLTVQDNLLLGAYIRLRRQGKAAVQQDMEQIFSMFPVLAERKNQLAGTLSGGEQQMLAVGRGLMAQPKLLLLDEPSLGLAPLLVREIFQVLVELRRVGTTILLVEQNARAALRIADRAYVLETGCIVMKGGAAELAADEDIQKAYLGRQNNQHEQRTMRHGE